jgi:hypothetical protein
MLHGPPLELSANVTSAISVMAILTVHVSKIAAVGRLLPSQRYVPRRGEWETFGAVYK